MEEELFETLRTIGLTEGESKTYLALLSIGASTVGPIIEKSGISASKVYVILDRLISKGLVGMIVQDKNKIFNAADPERILTYLDDEKQKIENNKNYINKIMPILKLKKDSVSKLPVVEFSKGRKGYEAFYHELHSCAKEGDEYLATSGKRISFALQNFWFKQSKVISEKGIPQYIAYENYTWHKKDPAVHRRAERKNYYPTILDKKYSNLPTIVITGDKTVINDVGDDERVFSLIIRNKNLTDAMRKLLMIVKDSGTVPKGFRKEP